MEHSNCPTNVEELLLLPAFEHDPVCVDERSSFGASHRGTDLLSWTQTHVRCEEWTGFTSNALSAAVEHPHTKLGDDRKSMFFNLFRLNWAGRRLDGKCASRPSLYSQFGAQAILDTDSVNPVCRWQH